MATLPPHDLLQLPPDDLLQLTNLTAETIASALEARFAQKVSCTYAGDILIALNPYAWVDGAHSDHVASVYKGRAIGELPPHLYAIASAIHASEDTRRHIVICGESGAGKTEAAKIVLAFLAFLEVGAVPPSPGGAPIPSLPALLLRTNPLLEAFGNASTGRNDNSSRFGKLIEVHYSRNGASRATLKQAQPSTVSSSGARLTGARIVDFLLEKTRAAGAAKGEKNFHVLYYIMHAPEDELSPEAVAALPLGQPEQIAYLMGQNGSMAATGDRERRGFAEVATCLEDMGVPQASRPQLWDIMAAMLLLGNLSFTESLTPQGAEGCVPAEAELLKRIASLLGVRAADLSTALCHRRLILSANRASPADRRTTSPAAAQPGGASTPGGAADPDTVILRTQSPSEAATKRDALAAALYAGVFKWLVATINTAMGSEDCHQGTFTPTLLSPTLRSGGSSAGVVHSDIGVLDIYGFETLGANSFEQLLINLANERLQQHFNEHVIGRELAEYRREGVVWTANVAWADSAPCVQLVDAILSATDDTWRFATDRTADKDLLQSLHARFGARGRQKHSCYREPKIGSSQAFAIAHYAGEVAYQVDGFCRKNKESLSQDLRELLATATSPWLRGNIRHLAPARPTRAPSTASRAVRSPHAANTPLAESTSANVPVSPVARSQSFKFRPPSVSEQFRSSLSELVGRLDTGSRLYVRCIKSNHDKTPWKLDGAACLEQLRNVGVLAAATIRQQGYPRRIEHARFARRYGDLLRRSGHQTRLCSPPDHLTTIARVCASVAPAMGKSTSDRGVCAGAPWQRGKSKVFLKEHMHARLETWLALRRRAVASKLAQAARGFLGRCAARREGRLVACQAACRGALSRLRLRQAVSEAFAQSYAERRAFACWQGGVRRRTRALMYTLVIQRLWRRRLASMRALLDGGDMRGSEAHEAVAHGTPAPKGMTTHGVDANAAVPAAAPIAGRGRCVSALSPPPAILLQPGVSVMEAARMMRDRRMEAAIVVDGQGGCGGIVTATDMARRVVALGRNPAELTVAEIMTRSPHVVNGACPAVDALTTMTHGRFRHLPVVTSLLNAAGSSVAKGPVEKPTAILNVTRCLFDVIDMLERAHAASTAILSALERSGCGGRDDDMILGPAFCSVLAPTLAGLARREAPPPVVKPTDSIRHAAGMLTSGITGVLVGEAGRVVGTVTPRCLLRALASGADTNTTSVRDCMLAPPPTPPACTTVLEALHTLQEEQASHVLLLDPSTGVARAMLDVLQLVCAALSHAGSSDASQLRSFWAGALAMQQQAEGDATLPSPSSVHSPDVRPEDSVSHAGSPTRLADGQCLLSQPVLQLAGLPPAAAQFLFKLQDGAGDVHRIPYMLAGCDERASTWAELRSRMQRRLPGNSQLIPSLTYIDDDSDSALINSDETLVEAVQAALAAGESCLAVSVSQESKSPGAAGQSGEGEEAAAASPGSGRRGAKDGHQPVAAAFLGGLIAASSLAVSVGLLAVKAAAAKR
jgi:CBS domain-containing protein